jgi:hypothetical protein
MVVLGGISLLEARFGPFSFMLILVLDGAWFAPNVPRAWKSFWAQPMVLRGDVCQVEARLGPFGDSVSLGARLVYSLRQIYQGHGNLFRHTNGTSRRHWSSGSSFWNIWG